MADICLDCTVDRFVDGLPPVCVYCGRKASVYRDVKFCLPRLGDQVIVETPLCSLHANYKFLNVLVIAAGSLVLIMGAAIPPFGLCCAAPFVALLAVLLPVMFIYQFMGYSAVEVRPDRVYLQSVSKRFAAAYRKLRQNERLRRDEQRARYRGD
jgi:hypothetical protein